MDTAKSKKLVALSPYKCAYCSFENITHVLLVSHVRKIHPNQEIPIKLPKCLESPSKLGCLFCHFCDFKCSESKRRTMWCHLYRHTGEEVPYFKEKESSLWYSFNGYSCSVCQYTQFNKEHIQSHIKNKHTYAVVCPSILIKSPINFISNFEEELDHVSHSKLNKSLDVNSRTFVNVDYSHNNIDSINRSSDSNIADDPESRTRMLKDCYNKSELLVQQLNKNESELILNENSATINFHSSKLKSTLPLSAQNPIENHSQETSTSIGANLLKKEEFLSSLSSIHNIESSSLSSLKLPNENILKECNGKTNPHEVEEKYTKNEGKRCCQERQNDLEANSEKLNNFFGIEKKLDSEMRNNISRLDEMNKVMPSDICNLNTTVISNYNENKYTIKEVTLTGDGNFEKSLSVSAKNSKQNTLSMGNILQSEGNSCEKKFEILEQKVKESSSTNDPGNIFVEPVNSGILANKENSLNNNEKKLKDLKVKIDEYSSKNYEQNTFVEQVDILPHQQNSLNGSEKISLLDSKFQESSSLKNQQNKFVELLNTSVLVHEENNSCENKHNLLETLSKNVQQNISISLSKDNSQKCIKSSEKNMEILEPKIDEISSPLINSNRIKVNHTEINLLEKDKNILTNEAGTNNTDNRDKVNPEKVISKNFKSLELLENVNMENKRSAELNSNVNFISTEKIQRKEPVCASSLSIDATNIMNNSVCEINSDNGQKNKNIKHFDNLRIVSDVVDNICSLLQNPVPTIIKSGNDYNKNKDERKTTTIEKKHNMKMNRKCSRCEPYQSLAVNKLDSVSNSTSHGNAEHNINRHDNIYVLSENVLLQSDSTHSDSLRNQNYDPFYSKVAEHQAIVLTDALNTNHLGESDKFEDLNKIPEYHELQPLESVNRDFCIIIKKEPEENMCEEEFTESHLTSPYSEIVSELNLFENNQTQTRIFPFNTLDNSEMAIKFEHSTVGNENIYERNINAETIYINDGTQNGQRFSFVETNCDSLIARTGCTSSLENQYGNCQNIDTTPGACQNIDVTSGACQNIDTTSGACQNIDMTSGACQNIDITSGAYQNIDITSGAYQNIDLTSGIHQDISTASMNYPNFDMTSLPENNVILCQNCDYLCTSWAVLVNHFKSHNGPITMELQTIIEDQLVETNIPIYVQNPHICGCDSCSIQTDSLESLKAHLVNCHRNATQFICRHCQKIMTNSREFVSHLRLHGPELYKCKFCSYIYWRIYDVIEHTNFRHQRSDIPISIRRIAKRKSKYYQNEKTQNSLYKPYYVNPVFKQKKSIKISKHPENNGQVSRKESTLSKCQNIVKYPEKVHKLLTEKSPSDEFKNKESVINGYNDQVFSAALFKCKYCTFNNMIHFNVVTHCQLKHPKKEVKVIKKPYGNIMKKPLPKNPQPDTNPNKPQMFTSCEIGEDIPIYVENPYVCGYDQCMLETHTASNLKLHLLTCHRECTVFVCRHCADISTNPRQFCYHLRLHGPQLFKCKFCSYVYWRPNDVNKHSLKKHKIEVKAIRIRSPLKLKIAAIRNKTIDNKEFSSKSKKITLTISKKMCSSYNSTSVNRPEYKSNILTNSNTLFKCKYCKFSSSFRIKIENHLKLFHPKSKDGVIMISNSPVIEAENKSHQEVEQIKMERTPAVQKIRYPTKEIKKIPRVRKTKSFNNKISNSLIFQGESLKYLETAISNKIPEVSVVKTFAYNKLCNLKNKTKFFDDQKHKFDYQSTVQNECEKTEIPVPNNIDRNLQNSKCNPIIYNDRKRKVNLESTVISKSKKKYYFDIPPMKMKSSEDKLPMENIKILLSDQQQLKKLSIRLEAIKMKDLIPFKNK